MTCARMLIGLATTAAQRLRTSAWPKQAQTLGSGRASSNAESHGRAMEHDLLLPNATSPCCSHVISSPASRHCAPSTGLGQTLGPIVCSSFQHLRSSSSSPAGCLHDSLSTAKHALINPASMPGLLCCAGTSTSCRGRVLPLHHPGGQAECSRAVPGAGRSRLLPQPS